jgi:putative DNA primase/helicase
VQMIQPNNTARPELQHDGKIMVAVGKSRKETKWKNKELAWSEMLSKLSSTLRTQETLNEYKRMPRTEQAERKDVGGFVGGMLKEGRRKPGNVAWRSLITLDADFATPEFWPTIEMLFDNAMALYSTHSHTDERPKYRLVAPLKRQVTPDEYKALSRFIAAEIGIDLFDDTTYQPERLMYWPSTASDGPFTFEYLDGEWLDPDQIFTRYPNWRDISTWPESSRATKTREKHAEKQGHPHEKPGLIGAFCRAFTIDEAIAEYLDDIYVDAGVPDRYTFTGGSAAAGVVVYDGLFSFSHHGTDPTSGMLCNAFDLVRIHKFGLQDEDEHPDTPIHKLPSYTAMSAWAVKIDAVKIELAEAGAAQAAEDFAEGEPEENPDAWKVKLQYSDKGGLQQTIHNAVIILRHDPKMKGCVALDEFTRRQMLKTSTPWKEVTHAAPWVDADDSALRHYLERRYGLTKRECISDAVEIVMRENGFHPIRDYIGGLKWDGVPRNDKLLIDFLGAEDNIYTREVARKWLAGAVARVFEPGIKFDTMLILTGPQGIGKSQFFSRLATRTNWFSDSVSKFDNSKEAMEQLAGKWVVEISELSVMKRNEVEHVKAFLSKQEDSYRPSYGRRIENYPRQCVFGGTTNRDDFLQDATGGRRFWPVEVSDANRMWAEMTKAVVDQIWAEAYGVYMMGEDILNLSPEADAIAKEQQGLYAETGGLDGMVEEFLNQKVPMNWRDMDITERREWLRGFDFGKPPSDGDGLELRTMVSGAEVFVECFNGRLEEYNMYKAREITDVMMRLNWKKTGRRVHIKEYGRQRVFERATRKK